MSTTTKLTERPGEPIYATILRNRSGVDAGCIDFNIKVKAVEDLDEQDKIELCNVAYGLYRRLCEIVGFEHDEEYAYKTMEEFENIVNVKVDGTFKIGWAMARIKNRHFRQLAKTGKM